MALTKITKELDIISQLPDQPNDVGGLTAAELKAKFDEAALYLKEFINIIMLPEIESAISSGTVDQISGGQLVDLSVSAAKIKNYAIIADKISNGAVTTAKIADGAVTTDKLADGCVVLGTNTTGRLPVNQGGTGATTIEGFKSSLGTFSVAQGGTGATKAADARTNLGITLQNLAEGNYGDTLPDSGTEGQVFFLKV